MTRERAKNPCPIAIPPPQVRSKGPSITKTLQSPDISRTRSGKDGICGINPVVVESKSAATKHTTQWVQEDRYVDSRTGIFVQCSTTR